MFDSSTIHSDGGLAVRHWFVVPVYVGSNPIRHTEAIMSRCIDYKWPSIYYGEEDISSSIDIDDKVSFDHDDERFVGKVVHVFNQHEPFRLFHVLVNGSRYEVDSTDNICKELTESMVNKTLWDEQFS